MKRRRREDEASEISNESKKEFLVKTTDEALQVFENLHRSMTGH